MTATANTLPPLRPVSANERVPPASLEAEQSVIGSALILGTLPPEADDLLVDDFYLPAHRAIWEALLSLAKRERPIDPLEIEAELRSAGDYLRIEGGTQYLMACASETPTATNVGSYVRIVREKAILRRVIAHCAESMSRAYGEFSSVPTFLAEHRERALELESSGVVAEPVRIGDDIGNVLNAIEERGRAPDKHAVFTGIHRFDRLTGGLREGWLIIVAARPGQGKTAWAGTVCTNSAKSGVPSFISSVEMQRDELIQRMLASEASVSTHSIANGSVARTDQMAHVFEAGRRLAPLPLWVDDRGSVTVSQICGTIRRWYSKHLGAVPPKGMPPKLALAAVDYVQIIDEGEHEERRDLAIGKMTKALKALSKSLRIPVVVLSQVSRKATERASGRPTLADLRESGAIEQDADLVIFPHRDLPADEDEAARVRNEPGDAEWIIGKNRHGPTGIVGVHWMPAFTRFDNRIADTEMTHWMDRAEQREGD